MDAVIVADLKESYGITFSRSALVTGGWMNKKWKISTESGDLLVKQYSLERFSRAQLKILESALQRQCTLEKMGAACPLLWGHGGSLIRWPDDKTAYIVMSFHPGKLENSETVTLPQMRSLGAACAQMHSAFARIPAPLCQVMPAFGGYTVDSLWENLSSRLANCPPDAPQGYRNALLALEPILNSIPDGFFDKFQRGFAHEDFHSGNILFDAAGVTAIVDFDRNCWSYTLHDVGRAVLSFALCGDVLNVKKIHAFLEGYSKLSTADIADALRLTWCIETPWWIQPEFFAECGDTPARFRDGILWLTKHWFELDGSLVAKR